MTPTRQLMIQGSIAALIPIALFIFLSMVNEGGGTQHYLRAIPIAGLVALSWYRPQVGGWALIALGMIFAALYVTNVPTIQLLPTLAIALLIFLPIVGSGYLFLRAHTKTTAQ
ncbi:MAG TPA: hypothetical protein VI483_00880 [Candidatus Paceibacterota bacterium]